MPNTPRGIWFPGGSDNINNISGLFSQQASSIDTVIGTELLKGGVAKFTDATARNTAFDGIAIPKGALSYLESDGKNYQWDGTTWKLFAADISADVWNPITLSAGWTVSDGDTPQWRQENTIIRMRGRAHKAAAINSAEPLGTLTGAPAGTKKPHIVIAGWDSTSGVAFPNFCVYDATSADRNIKIYAGARSNNTTISLHNIAVTYN